MSLIVLEKILKKYKTFFFPIEKEVTKIDKDGNQSVDTTSYKVKLIESARLVTTLLSNFINNFAGGSHKIKCKDFDCFREYESVKHDLI